MSITLIIGANRGIGLELCRQLIEKNTAIVAVCRNSSTELEQLNIEIIKDIDVSQQIDIETLKTQLNGRKISTLIHNAGICNKDSLADIDFSAIEQQFQINTLAPLKTIHALLDHFQTGSKIAILSSQMGSITDNQKSGFYGYRISKAAINMAGVCLAKDLAPREIAVTLLHPGYVSTDMTDYNGDISPQQSVQGLIKIIDKLDMSNSGMFWHTNGQNLSW